jgi:UDPglucose 6-dehydrogenase
MGKRAEYKVGHHTIYRECEIGLTLMIVGSGVVGQATGMVLALYGNTVLFNDVDKDKLLTLKKKGYETTGKFREAVCNSDVVFVCVPTPTVDNQVDLSCMKDCTKAIGEALKKADKYVVIAFKSTIPPRTTRTKLIPILEKYSGLKVGKDFGVCMNPEFLREQSSFNDFLNPSRIVIGESDKKAGDVLERVYAPFKCPIIRTNLDTAEMIKYASNLFLATKISFFNEIYMICKKLGIDAKTLSHAVSLDPRIGKYGVNGGKPFGGMCLPKDLDAFIAFAKSKGVNPELLEAVKEINRQIALFDSKG